MAFVICQQKAALLLEGRSVMLWNYGPAYKISDQLTLNGFDLVVIGTGDSSQGQPQRVTVRIHGDLAKYAATLKALGGEL